MADASSDNSPKDKPDAPPVAPTQPRPRRLMDYSQLPGYSRSLLRVEVPVSVCLASKKQTVSEITNLGPGSIISFDKSCDDDLDLLVGDEPVARGEAVKIGEKFGLRISEMILPEEHFKTVRKNAS